MRFGDRDQLAFDLNALEPTWDRRGPSSLGPWARLSVWLRGVCLTRATPNGVDIRDGVVVPLAPLAAWLVGNLRAIALEESPALVPTDPNPHDALAQWQQEPPPAGISPEGWEDERYAWWSRHFWISGAEGAMLPDLAFARADERLWVSWAPPRFGGARRLEFLSGSGWSSAAWGPAFAALADLVDFVGTELRARGLDHWPELRAEHALTDAAKWEARDYLRFLPAGAGQLLTVLGLEPTADPEASPALLAARHVDLRLAPEQILLQALVDLERSTTLTARTADRLNEHRARLASSASTGRPEECGYGAAQAFRSELGKDVDPIESTELEGLVVEIASLGEVSATSVAADALVGARLDKSARVILVKTPRSGRSWARRMELARALGHLMLDAASPRRALGAASSRVARGPKRRRSGAFAAELLLPELGLRRKLSGRDPTDESVFEELMAHFGVGARTAAYQLWNKRLLASEEERDQLIARFGWKETGGGPAEPGT